MPKYSYTAKIQPQKTIQSEIEAESEEDAITKLTRMGYFPLSIQPQDLSPTKRVWNIRRSSHKDIVVLTGQLAGLLESGINILNSFNLLSAQAPNKYLKAILDDIAGRIKDGKSLSDSLAGHPYLFSELYTAMVHSGEAGGNIGAAMRRLADFLEKEEEFKNSLRAALIYPAFVFIIGLLTVVGLLIFVIPRLVTMFKDMGQVLPLPTRILINTSGLLRNYGWFILIIIFLFIFILRRLLALPQARMLWDRFKLKIAIFGDIVLKTELSRMIRTLGLLLSSGLPITPALNIAGAILNNRVLKAKIDKVGQEINRGTNLSTALKEAKLFPELVVNVVAIGEETGKLAPALMRVSDDYEREIDRRLKGLTRMLEPIIILLMGLVVGFIVLSMLLPIFQINIVVR